MKRQSRCLKSFIVLLAVGLSARAFGADVALQPNDLLAICGDSITEQKIYSAYIEEYVLACQPVTGVRSMQFGWSGDTSWGFLGNKLRQRRASISSHRGHHLLWNERWRVRQNNRRHFRPLSHLNAKHHRQNEDRRSPHNYCRFTRLRGR